MDSNFSLKTKSNLVPPFIVEVYEATLCNDKSLKRPLSKVVKPGDNLNEIYITVFSTLEAEAYVAAAQNPDEAGEAAKMAAFNSLGLDLKAEVLDDDPRTSGQLEFAQQALLLVLGLSDDEGLAVTPGDDPLKKIAEKAAQDGAEFTAANIQATAGLDAPPYDTLDPNALKKVKQAVNATFEDGAEGGAGETKGEAWDQVKDLGQGDLNTLPGRLELPNVPVSMNAWGVTQAKTPQCLGTITIKSVNNTLIDGARFNAHVDGAELAYGDSNTIPPTEGWSHDLESVEISSAKFLWGRVPESGLEPGLYVATFSSMDDPTVKKILTLNVVGNGQVTVEAVAAGKVYPDGDDGYLNGGYLGFEPETGSASVRTYVPNGSEAIIAYGGDNGFANGKPIVSFTLKEKLIGATAVDKLFDVFMTAPEGMKFITENNALQSTLRFQVQWKEGAWAVPDSEKTIIKWVKQTTKSPSLNIKLPFRGDFAFAQPMALRAVSDLSFGEYAIKVRVEDPAMTENKVLASTSLPIWALNKKSANWLGRIEQVKSGEDENLTVTYSTDSYSCTLRGNAAFLDYPGATDMPNPNALLKTWEQLTGIIDSRCELLTLQNEQGGDATARFVSMYPFENGQDFAVKNDAKEIQRYESEFEVSFEKVVDLTYATADVPFNTTVEGPKDTGEFETWTDPDTGKVHTFYLGFDRLIFEITIPEPDGPGSEPYKVRNTKSKSLHCVVAAI